MTTHPVLALRSAGSGFRTVCSGRTTHRGHPMWHLVHRLQPTQLHQTIQLPALSLGFATSVARRATILVSVPRISVKSRMLHHVPEATTTTVAGLPKVYVTKPAPPSTRGRVNQISAEETDDTSDVILGTLPVNYVPTSVLFDPGASHSFMSESYALRHNLPF